MTAVKQTKLDQYRIVYFATHALIGRKWNRQRRAWPNPLLVLSLPFTATAFDDGLLTSSEVAQLKLNASWVVLSANTAAAEKPGPRALSVWRGRLLCAVVPCWYPTGPLNLKPPSSS